MYLGAVIAIAGGYLTFVTMDSKDSFSFSSFSTTERIASVTESFEKNSAAFVQWRDNTTARIGAWRDKQNSGSAPTPSFSLSSFFKSSSRAIVWIIKTMQKKIKEMKNKFTAIDQHEEQHEDTDISAPEIENVPIIKAVDEIPSQGPLSSLSPWVPTAHKFTIFLTAKKPQIYSFLQRLDVTAAILSMMFLLLLVFLYHKRIKSFLSICFLPAMGLVMCFGMGKASFRVYRWYKEREKIRERTVTLIVSMVKNILRSISKAYPVEYLYEEIKETVTHVNFNADSYNDAGAGRQDSGDFSPIPQGQKVGDLEGEAVKIDKKMFKWLWGDVEKEVSTDKRVVQAMMLYDGAKRKCWKIQGRNSSFGGKVDISSPNPQSYSTTDRPNNSVIKSVNKRWSIFIDLIKWIGGRIGAYVLLLVSLLLVIRFSWIRYSIWWCFMSVFRFIKYILFQS